MKTPFKKNLDRRYISGEDLKDGIELGKGLAPEMIVTLAKFNDAPAFDQKLQKEVNKTALWLKKYPSGEMIYKPCLLNVGKAIFMAKELANNSLFIDDCDTDKPFIIYAKPHKRHGHVVEFKSYILPTAPKLPELTPDHKKWDGAKKSLKEGNVTIDQIKASFILSSANEKLLTNGK